ncbi:MAG: class I mannose-6-phosphate isomerase [Oscillospiraceae bacterium]|nr:class I mannose-6-phosphate isomerase [Oscillospiraceae bacterium]
MNIYKQPWKLVQNRIRGRGGREIDKLRGISPPVDDNSGSEAWIGSVTRVGNPPKDRPDYGCSEVMLPDGRQMFLFEAIGLSPLQTLGEKHISRNGSGMGMLIKYLDAASQYGLQCHPTREFAKKMWGSDYGKEESWYVIGVREDTKEPAYILLGFKEGVSREEWEKHYRKDDIAALENLCHKIQVKAGEAYFVGGGVPHALGEGCFVVEVQEPCDITLGAHTYEYIKEHWGIDSIDKKTYDERLLGSYIYDGCTFEENLRRWRIPRKIIRSGEWGKEEIIIGTAQTRFFSFTELTLNGSGAADILNTGFPKVAVVLKGDGKLCFGGGEMQINRGDEIFLPFNVPEAKVTGNAAIILCHPEGVINE